MSRSMFLYALVLGGAGLYLAGCGGSLPVTTLDELSDSEAEPDPEGPEATHVDLSHDHAHPDAAVLKDAVEWQQNLLPVFEQEAQSYEVPLDLLLVLAKLGSGFENRGGVATVEGGYGLMALRDNHLQGDSLPLGASLLGVDKDVVIRDPAVSIRAAAAVLDQYATTAGVDRSAGLEAWLPAIITFAGLDEEDSNFFAVSVYELLEAGFDHTNSYGERFVVLPRPIGLDLDALVPPGVKRVTLADLEAGLDPDSIKTGADPRTMATPDYPGAIWDPAASCNYSTTVTSKDTIIIHTIEGSAAGARSWFKNCNSNVSSHYVVSEAGTVWQMVEERHRAFHVGCYNSRSVGIEHEGFAGSSSHPASLYNASALLSRNICDRRGIPKQHRTVGPGILGHVDANNCCCGGSHWDPGPGWDWSYYINQVIGGTPLNSAFVNQSYQATMQAGSQAVVWVEYKNTGTETWQRGGSNPVHLGTWNPQDRSSAFYADWNWLGPNRPTDMDVGSCPPGATCRFTFLMQAPSTPGVYTEYWRLVKEGVAWFGYDGVWFQVTVTGNDTQAPSVPTGLTATAVSTGQINLNWNASSDNVGVTGYNIYRNGSYLTSVGGTSYANGSLSMGTTYSYRVSAYDAAGNESGQSSPAEDSTWLVVDNSDAGFTASGVWATSSYASDRFGPDYRWRSTEAISDAANWNFNIPTADNYEVYAWWSQGSNRSPAAPYIVYYNGGSQAVPVNQQINGGGWNSLGIWNFAAGSNDVKLSCWTGSGYVVVADAILLVRR